VLAAVEAVQANMVAMLLGILQVDQAGVVVALDLIMVV
jgi:hypothetical protein